MLSEALQRNAKHEARLSNISVRVYLILRFAQNDRARFASINLDCQSDVQGL